VLRRFLGRWLTGGKSLDSDDIPSLRWRLGSAHEPQRPEGAIYMTSAPIRDQLSDHLLTPENAAFLFIDYQLTDDKPLDRTIVLTDRLRKE
jgi:hypothetical protein